MSEEENTHQKELEETKESVQIIKEPEVKRLKTDDKVSIPTLLAQKLTKADLKESYEGAADK